jgi:hypothetical protein
VACVESILALFGDERLKLFHKLLGNLGLIFSVTNKAILLTNSSSSFFEHNLFLSPLPVWFTKAVDVFKDSGVLSHSSSEALSGEIFPFPISEKKIKR